MITYDELIHAGKLLKPHGYKGEMNAVFDYELELLKQPDIPVILEPDNILTPFFVESVRPKGTDALLIKFEDINSDTETRPLVNKILYLRKKDVAEFLDMEEEELEEYLREVDYHGYTVYSDSGEKLGEISDIEPGVEYDYFILKGEDGKEIMIPFVDEYILEEDSENKLLKIVLPEDYLNHF